MGKQIPLEEQGSHSYCRPTAPNKSCCCSVTGKRVVNNILLGANSYSCCHPCLKHIAINGTVYNLTVKPMLEHILDWGQWKEFC